ncbi:MAG: dienelactone hydrolase family protein [Thermoproteota archaeon]|nr:dienelactone hydrolase family protein [Thermoproteota archaeon]
MASIFATSLNSKDHPLSATVIYYGILLTNDTKVLFNITWPVLGIFGAQDMAIPVVPVKQFQMALNETGITNEIYVYPGVGHAFANSSNDNFVPKETADAWKRTLDFLRKYVYLTLYWNRNKNIHNIQHAVFFKSDFSDYG